ncbi:hypothetical protein ACNKHP_09440 [Shigella boydii]
MPLSISRESINPDYEKSWGLDRIVTEIFYEVAEAHLISQPLLRNIRKASRWRAVIMLTRKSPTVLNSSSVVVKSVMVLAN